MKIGVLCMQGAVREHVAALKKCGVDVECVKRKEQFADLDGLVIPGGESTTIGKLIERFDLTETMINFIQQGKPVYGTCAGMILLAKQVDGPEQVLLGQMDITVARNAFGRQRESFEQDLPIAVLGDKPYCAVFIRAPLIKSRGDNVQVLATCNHEVVAARQDNILVSAFHPELTNDERMHRYFVDMAHQYKNPC